MNDCSTLIICYSINFPASLLHQTDSSSDDDSIFDERDEQRSSNRSSRAQMPHSSDSSPGSSSGGGGGRTGREPPPSVGGNAIYANINIPGNTARSALADVMKQHTPSHRECSNPPMKSCIMMLICICNLHTGHMTWVHNFLFLLSCFRDSLLANCLSK